jgi:transposase
MGEIGAYVGIDWGDRRQSVVVWDVAGGAIEEGSIEQTAEALHDWAAGLGRRYAGQRVAVAIEQARGAVFDVLLGYEFLKLYPINPRSAARYREAFRPSNPKDDPTDAASLLDMLLKHGEQLRPFIADDAETRTLRLLCEDRRALVDERTAHIQRLQDRLKTYFPQGLEWAGGLDTLQACEFLERWPSLAAVQSEEPEAIRTFYRQHAHGKAWSEQKIEQIRSAVPLMRDQAVITAAVLMVRSEVAQLRALRTAIGEYDRQIAALFSEHQDSAIFRSFPGAGRQLAPRLAVAFGSVRDRYARAVEVAERSGIAPVVRRSGKSTVIKMRWAAPAFMRQTFHEFARLSIGRSSWAAAFYCRQREAGHGRHAAIRALAYRWIRIMYRCWKDRRPYDEARYLAQLAERGSPLAQART